jgi:hypothetical protein
VITAYAVLFRGGNCDALFDLRDTHLEACELADCEFDFDAYAFITDSVTPGMELWANMEKAGFIVKRR